MDETKSRMDDGDEDKGKGHCNNRSETQVPIYGGMLNSNRSRRS